MARVDIIRLEYGEKQTLGHLIAFDELKEIYSCKTLELPWKHNERRVSCIPTGQYKVIKHDSPKFGECFWVQDVPGRSEILIHYGNFYYDILGCILPGRSHVDIDFDGLKDVNFSRDTMDILHKILPDIFILNIH